MNRFGCCRTEWQLQEIEKTQDGTFSLFYDTPDGGRKVRCGLITAVHSHTSMPLHSSAAILC